MEEEKKQTQQQEQEQIVESTLNKDIGPTNIEDIQKSLEADLNAHQELQSSVAKLNDLFETSSTASYNVEVDIKDLRELKSLNSPPKMVKYIMEVAFLCLIQDQRKKLEW